MNELPRLTERTRLLLIGGLVAFGLVIGTLLGQFFLHGHVATARVFYSHADIALSAVNLVLMAVLIFVYSRLYARTRSRFTAGLLGVVLAFFAFVVTSNPILQEAQGYHSMALGAYAFLPDLFASVAFAFLLYLSLE